MKLLSPTPRMALSFGLPRPFFGRSALRSAGVAGRGLRLMLLSLGLAIPASAWAGGLFLPYHGVRGLGRAGALVAGGDDPGGIWYNPALIDRQPGHQLLVDAAAVLLAMRYSRIDSGGNPLPEVSNSNPPLAVPTIAYTMPSPWGKKLWLGASLSGGSGVLPSYPRPGYGPCGAATSGCIDTVHRDAPQRYTLVTLDGTLFVRMDFAVAWQITPELTLGASLQNHVAIMKQIKSISSDNGVLASGPEDPDFDGLIDTRMSDFFNPSAQVGLSWRPRSWLTVAAAVQLPVIFSSGAELAIQLPVSPLYAASTVEGTSAEVGLHFPLSIAAGVELRPLPELRIELDLVWEHWGSLKAISFEPKDIIIKDLPGIGDLRVAPTQEVLGYQDVISIRLGGEYTLPWLPLILRAGYGWERGATPFAYTSVLSNDTNKHLLTMGVGVNIWRLRLDFGYGVVITPDRHVPYDQSKVPQINPVNPSGVPPVGGGSYRQSHHLVGAGVVANF